MIPGLGRSPEGGHGNPLQYSCLENPWTEEPGRLQSMWLQRVEHEESNMTKATEDGGQRRLTQKSYPVNFPLIMVILVIRVFFPYVTQ